MRTPTPHVNAGRPRTVTTPTDEDTIMTAVGREPWRVTRYRTRIGTVPV
jgi:hypothetical protein